MSDSDLESADHEKEREADQAAFLSEDSLAEEIDDAVFNAIRPGALRSSATSLPKRIRRYRVEKLLGEGTFGKVYLARDDQLRRDVAIKVPSPEVLNHPGQADAYLAEARTIANLEHPHIVPVYDVGSTYDYPCFIVTRFIDGIDLAKASEQKRLPREEALQLVITIARALHYAHERGVVHRDVKPENILIDRSGKPFLVDLGLALTNENAGRGPKTLGTPAYMSPEQARGEGHRVDGRTDVYSLGVVLYELLVGRRPFDCETFHSMLYHIVHETPPPLREFDESVPEELERICLRCLAKWAADRYPTAQDFADELQAFFDEESGADAASVQKSAFHKKVKIVPKGLRNYDRQDAEAFLALLPGPVDRHGNPDSIAFWKRQIDPLADPSNRTPFDIGVIYGPSGCGKSSLIQAGLIPRLSDRVTVVFIQATAFDTEQRLLDQLRRKFPTLPQEMDLAAAMHELRTDEDLRRGGSVLLVLDQFEQWLSRQKLTASEYKLSPLASALRQCDGRTLQTILLIRDDFWVSITEFLRAVDVKMSEGFNLRCVSPFDEEHARSVLQLLGAAYGRLPENPEELTPSQQEFLSAAIKEISEEGRTTSIKIALIAEMLKGQEWIPETLQQMGGLQGIGVRYLEQQFDDSTAPPHHKRYRKQVEAVLSAMLPPVGESIRGQRMSDCALAEACRWAVDSQAFQELIEILDRETRIITPVDVEGSEGDAIDSSGEKEDSQVSYQLTHDYLVPSIRQWLRAKQTQTRSGRARLLLKERSDAWNAHPQNRRLPSLLELLNLSLFVRNKERTVADRRMLRRATAYYTLRVGAIATVLAVATYFTWGTMLKNTRENRRTRAESLVGVLKTSPIEAVPLAVMNLRELQTESFQLVQLDFDETHDEAVKLRLGLALADFGDIRIPYLSRQIPGASPATMKLLIGTLSQKKEAAIKQFVQLAAAEQNEDNRARFFLAVMDVGGLAELSEPLSADADPTERSYWICHFQDWPHRWEVVIDHLVNVDDPDVHSALLLGLSRVAADDIPQAERKQILALVRQSYLEHPSPLVHSACFRLLADWNETLPDVPEKSRPGPDDRWYQTPNGFTMIRVQPPVEQVEKFLPYQRIPEQGIWVSDRETTIRDFQQFLDDREAPERKELRRKLNLIHAKTREWLRESEPNSGSIEYTSLDQPVEQVHLEDCILFCNWLSRREGYQPSYTRMNERLFFGDNYKEGTGSNYGINIHTWRLDRHANGYRLWTQPEWMVVNSGRSQEKYPFGRDETWFESFEVVSPASTAGVIREFGEPTRSRLPNNYGLFDVYGNAPEWGHYLSKPENADYVELEQMTSNFGKPWFIPKDRGYTGSSQKSFMRDYMSFRVVRNISTNSGR